jgi:AbrB family looped-hinge helix DNA binding protein
MEHRVEVATIGVVIFVYDGAIFKLQGFLIVCNKMASHVVYRYMKSKIKGNFMPPMSELYGTSTMNEKGQIVIPAEARKKFHIKAGDRFLIMGAPFDEGIIIIRSKVFTERLGKIAKILKERP